MPDSSGVTVLDDLPEWLVVDEILVRLPSKDILRCRVVRKSWRNGTSTDKFIRDHHGRQPSLPIIFQTVVWQAIRLLHKGICRLPVLSDAGVCASGDKKIQLIVRYTPGMRFAVLHHASCDGLLILSQQDDFYICNPATRRCAPLLHPPRRPGISRVTVVGFYWHHTSGEHRVLWAVYSKPSLDIVAVELPDYFVLTVGSDQPRSIQWPTVSEQGFPATESSYHPPVHHRGSLHWATGLSITVFDTVAETFRQMSRPAQLGSRVTLLDTGGALALCTTNYGFTLDVWVLQDYDAETWGFQYRINLLAMVASPPLDFGLQTVPRIAVINEHEMLIQHAPNRLLHCDINGVFQGNVENEENDSYLALSMHRLQESMISLPLLETPEEDAVNGPPFLMVL